MLLRGVESGLSLYANFGLGHQIAGLRIRRASEIKVLVHCDEGDEKDRCARIIRCEQNAP